jgi:pantothenate kinase
VARVGSGVGSGSGSVRLVARRLLGIAGAPGAGKTTYARRLVAESVLDGVPAAYVPMDGFHLADGALSELGLLDRKGAPETFDAWGYAALLRRLRRLGHDPDHEAGPVIWAPAFERDLEQPVAGAIAVPAAAELVVTEGNYLLLPQGQWWLVRLQLDACWFVDVEDDVRRGRLQARHESFGRSPDEAAARTNGSDESNARLVNRTRGEADATVRPVALTSAP